MKTIIINRKQSQTVCLERADGHTTVIHRGGSRKFPRIQGVKLLDGGKVQLCSNTVEPDHVFHPEWRSPPAGMHPLGFVV